MKKTRYTIHQDVLVSKTILVINPLIRLTQSHSVHVFEDLACKLIDKTLNLLLK